MIELARQTENQPGLYAVLEHRSVHSPQRGVDDVVGVQRRLKIPLHRIEAKLDLGDLAAAVLLANHLVDRALDRQRGALNLLGPGVHDLEVVLQGGDFARSNGDQLHEFAVIFHRKLEPLLMSDRPEDVRGNCSADVDVQVGQLARHRQK